MTSISIDLLAKKLIEGQLVIVPTETVYGLAANALNREAVNNIFKAKGRPQDNPLIVHVHSKEGILRYSKNQPDYLNSLIEHFSPGPLTYVLETNHLIPSNITANLDTIAMRIPDNPIFINLLKECNLPLAAPSANISGRPSSTNFKDARNEFSNSNLVNYGLDGGKSSIGIESTVIRCNHNQIIILRHGTFKKEDIEKVVEVPVVFNRSKKLEAPGQKYKHYSPAVKVSLVNSFENYNTDIFLFGEYGESKYYSINESNIYDFFREGETKNKDILILETSSLKNNLALFDRIKKATS
ncbi:L-threonylcarbamoyladenylate synthase [Candidatus Kapabacteria bacterium]|nr:L-threonylcarbamoyladenylate synthase [Candidatus Kapabacteria bacterium]